MRAGVTLPELLLVLVMIACLLALVMPSVHRTLDRVAVTNAGVEVWSLLAKARHQAISRRERTAIRFSPAGMVIVHAGRDTLLTRNLKMLYGVALTATRDSIAFGPTGRGHGAANTTIILKRGHAHDSVVVSRLGRVRRR